MRPYTYRSPTDPTEVIGFDVDLAKSVFACIGVPVKFVVGAWGGLIPSVIVGQTDIMWDHLFYSPERAQQVDFVLYMTGSSGAMVRKGNPKALHSLADLCGVRAGAVLGSVEAAKLQEINQACTSAGKPQIQIITYPDKPDGIQMVKTDRAERPSARECDLPSINSPTS